MPTINPEIENFRDIHRGKVGLVVANGPSLDIQGLPISDDIIAFGFNRIFLSFSDVEWRPDYYLVCDRVVAEENVQEINKLDVPKIFASSTAQALRNVPDTVFVPPPRRGAVNLRSRSWFSSWRAQNRNRKEYLISDHEFPDDWLLSAGARAGHSVVNFSLKVAFWMGIRRVVVTGLDHKFETPSAVTGEKVYGNDVVISQGESNHFHPDYRKQGERWTVPQLDLMEAQFKGALQVYRRFGGEIINASRQTAFDGWPRMRLEDAMRASKRR